MNRLTSPTLIIGGIASVITALLLCGCPTGAELDNPDRYVTPCDPPSLFISTCSGSPCHGVVGSPQPPLNSDLVSPGFEQLLIDVPASYDQVTTNQAACPVDNPELLIDSQNPERSLLLTKLDGTHACGERMPYFSEPLDDNAIECVRRWIIDDVLMVGSTGTGGAGTGGVGTGGAGTGGGLATGGVGTGGDVATGGVGTGGVVATGGVGTGGTP